MSYRHHFSLGFLWLLLVLGMAAFGCDINGLGGSGNGSGGNGSSTTELIDTNPSPPSGMAPLEISFLTSAADDHPDATFLWELGDNGATSTEASPSHTYTTAGLYEVTLTVSEGGNPILDTPVTLDQPVEVFDWVYGSPYWYEGHDVANPLKSHTPQEAQLAQDVFALVNQERAAESLAPLAWDDDIAVAAKVHSADMAARGYFYHIGPEGFTPWDRMDILGVSYNGAGENIAWGQPTAEDVMDAWMNSSGHRANILGNFTHIGVGVHSEGSIRWTQKFVSR